MRSAPKFFAGLMFCLSILMFAGCNSNPGENSGNPYAGAQAATFSTTARAVTAAPSPTIDPDSPIFLNDDFSDPSSGWDIAENEYGRVAYENGSYMVEARVKGEYYWGVARIDAFDIQIDVDVSVVETIDSKNDGFGIDCRIQENGDGYGFRISSDGYVSIARYVDTHGESLWEWTESSAVNTDGRSNHLTAICQGNHLRFLVNDIFIAEVQDDTFTHGDIAMSALVFEDGTVKVLFDNLVVKNLNTP